MGTESRGRRWGHLRDSCCRVPVLLRALCPIPPQPPTWLLSPSCHPIASPSSKRWPVTFPRNGFLSSDRGQTKASYTPSHLQFPGSQPSETEAHGPGARSSRQPLLTKWPFPWATWTLPSAHITLSLTPRLPGADMTPYITEREPGALECGRSGQRPPGWGDQTWSLAPDLTPELVPTSILPAAVPSCRLGTACVSSDDQCVPMGPLVPAVLEKPREQRRVKAWRRAGHVSSSEHRCQHPDQEESAGPHGSSHTTWLQEGPAYHWCHAYHWSHVTRKSSISDLLPNTRRYELVKRL